jgi:predicted RNase H-like HicB family nuclease
VLTRLSAVVEQDANGYFAYCPELSGCQSQGRSLEVVLSRLQDAATLYLKALSVPERESLLTARIFTTTIDVELE